MVMGPTHAFSSAVGALGGLALYTSITGVPVHPTITVMTTVVAAGAALAPDIDSGSSTVVNSFGIFGKATHAVVNAVSVAVYNITKTRREEPKTNGHRTLFHTTVIAILAGVLTALLTLPTDIITIFGRDYTWGQLNAIILSSIFINLALSGLLGERIKRARRKFGPYVLMGVSLALAAVIALFVPHPTDTSFGLGVGGGSYAYLGIAVTFGWIMHLLGDAITKMGVPMAWPIKVRGKRWYDVALPSFMRIRADGAFEKVFLLPVCIILFLALSVYHFISYGATL